MRALVENIERYEAANGKIQDLEQIELPLNFGGPTAQAWSQGPSIPEYIYSYIGH